MAEVQLTTIRVMGDEVYRTNNVSYGNSNQAYVPDVADGNKTEPEVITDANDVFYKEKPGFNRSKEVDVGISDVGDNQSMKSSLTGLEIDRSENCFARHVQEIQNGYSACCAKNKRVFTWMAIAVLLAGYVAYFGCAMYYEFGSEPSVRLLWVTCVVVFFIGVHYLFKFCGENMREAFRPCLEKMAGKESLISWLGVSALFLAMIIFTFVDIFLNTKQPYNLVSGSGLIVYVVLFFVTSVHPAKVQWRAVAWGVALQFLFAILILRWSAGFSALEWLGEQFTIFLAYSDVGAEFVYGESFEDHFFAFKVLSNVIFFSAFVAVMYHLGAMQVVINSIAGAMQFVMGTTAGESLSTAANIFVGQNEAPLVIRPLLPHMTRSELHAVMTGGFASIAGSVMAGYIAFGVPANHLLSASLMSAPAALAMAKLNYPESEQSITTAKEVKQMVESKETNVLAAAANGATQAAKIIASMGANLIAFLALLAFVDSTLTWFGQRVGLFEPELTFELITSYVLYPFAFVMGVVSDDCRQVARLIGVKTFLNEFVAYSNLGVLIDNRGHLEEHVSQNGTWYYENDNIILDPLPGNNETTTLLNGVMAIRSEVIATYALCGFSNVGSIGVQIGCLGALAPNKRNDLAAVAIRAMITGTVACFMTASIAGLFYQQV